MQKQTWQRYFSWNSRLTSFIGQNGINQCLYQNMLKLVQDWVSLGESESYRKNGLLCHSWLQRSSTTFHSVCMPICMCVWAADALYGSLLYLLESESLTDPGVQWFRQIDDQWVPEPTDSFISLFPSPVMRTGLGLYVPQCWEQDSGPHTCEAASSHRVVLLAFRSWFKEVKVMIRLWIHTAVIPASNMFDDIQ